MGKRVLFALGFLWILKEIMVIGDIKFVGWGTEVGILNKVLGYGV